MQNNYTTNNWNVTASMFQTQLIQFAEPKIAFVKGLLVELSGMNLVTVMNPGEDKVRNKFSTYRILLEKSEMRPYTTLEYYDGEYSFYFMPENRMLTTDDFNLYVSRLSDRITVLSALENLDKYGFKLTDKPADVTCIVSCYKKEVYISSDLFYIHFKLHDSGYVWPTDMYDILNLFNYLKVPFKFVPATETNAKEKATADDLARLLAAYEKDNLYTNDGDDSVDWDGTYVYSKDLGKIEMSREEYFKRFPDASIMVRKPK